MIFKGKYKILSRNFYDRGPEIVAKDLLGKYLIRVIRGKFLIGKIVETEAYLPFDDPAAHSFKGKNEGNKSTFGPPGYAYIHSSRHHTLLDIVNLSINIPGSVLLRALEPIEGITEMKKNRNSENLFNLTSGPAKLCQALNITKQEDGIDVTEVNSNLFIARDIYEKGEVLYLKSPRIGISKAKELLLRYFIKNNPFVSKLRN